MKINEFKTRDEVYEKVFGIFGEQPDEGYLLMLSGGEGLSKVYNQLSFKFDYPFPKDIALSDEKWGKFSQHQKSNEIFLKNSGFLGRIKWAKSNFHPVLSAKPLNPEREAKLYEEELRQLFETYENRVFALLEMETDGSIAGILPESEPIESENYFLAYESGEEFKYRLTVSVKCLLEYFSRVILLVDGEEKCGHFNKITSFESDARKYPLLLLKNLSDVEVMVYSGK